MGDWTTSIFHPSSRCAEGALSRFPLRPMLTLHRAFSSRCRLRHVRIAGQLRQHSSAGFGGSPASSAGSGIAATDAPVPGAGTRSGSRSDTQESWDNASLGAAMLGVAVAAVGLSYASVPLYRIFCQATGFGGTVKTHKGVSGDEGYDLPADPSTLTGNRPLKITFNSDVSGDLNWSFRPVQKSVTVLAGLTALAFFEATNHSSEPVIGVATYNVAPMQAGTYFNKIQCFCFDEQRLLPGETVDMPVFFYIDPEYLQDRRMKNINTMTLSYTFFHSSDVDI